MHESKWESTKIAVVVKMEEFLPDASNSLKIELLIYGFALHFESIVYNRAKVYIHQNFLNVVVHVIIIDQ